MQSRESGRSVSPLRSGPSPEVFAIGGLLAGIAVLLKWMQKSGRVPARKMMVAVGAGVFWGGCTAWTVRFLFPTLPVEVIGVVCAVLGHAGIEATVAALDDLLVRRYLSKGARGE
jgi:hypothetical protein